MSMYEYLRPFTTGQRQIELLDALSTGLGICDAAAKIGMNTSNASKIVKTLEGRAALQGVSPEHGRTNAVPQPFSVKGTSTLYGPDGEIKQQWVKDQVSKEAAEELFLNLVESFAEDLPRYKPVPLPCHCDHDLLNFYPIADYHLGQLSWPEETGEAWDLEIAEELLDRWFQTAIESSPKSGTGVLALLGDFLHFDGLEPLTPKSKHILDVDTRFQKVVSSCIKLIRKIIRALLIKHEHVHVIIAEGNHDPVSGIWLREWLNAVYEEEKRVTVDNSADAYYCYEFGMVSLFVHHGHLRKPERIHDVFAAKFREVWGRTKYSYAHMGHMHSNKVIETNLVEVEQHRTLAAKDAYASKGGWMSGRDAKVITYHKDYGRVSSLVISPEMVK